METAIWGVTFFADGVFPFVIATPEFSNDGRPREKLLYRGEESCADEELLASILRSGTSAAPVVELARKAMLAFGGLPGLARAKPTELLAIHGLGPARAASIAAAFALGRRVATLPWDPDEELRAAQQVYARFRDRLSHLRKERFYALLLDGKNRLIREDLVSEGTLTASLVHPREVFGPAIREGAASLIVLHNHPSGDARPSAEDLEVTRRLKKTGEIVGIPILDHLVIGRSSYYSFAEQGAF